MDGNILFLYSAVSQLEAAQARVVRYAQEIAPSFNAYIYFRFGYWLAKGLGRLLYRVRVGLKSSDQLKGISPDSSVVLVMNHRSNMDYILVSFLVAEKTALSYAVCKGQNLALANFNKVDGGFIESKEGLLRARSKSLDMIKHYANSISHWW